MPEKVRQCIHKGQKGWSAGKVGECYVGAGAREKAVAQAQAINIIQGRAQGKSWAMKLPEPKK